MYKRQEEITSLRAELRDLNGEKINLVSKVEAAARVPELETALAYAKAEIKEAKHRAKMLGADLVDAIVGAELGSDGEARLRAAATARVREQNLELDRLKTLVTKREKENSELIEQILEMRADRQVLDSNQVKEIQRLSEELARSRQSYEEEQTLVENARVEANAAMKELEHERQRCARVKAALALANQRLVRARDLLLKGGE